jgi:hypothetical protein
MIWSWRPAQQWRGTRKPWFVNARLNEIEMSETAAMVIYRCFNLIPDLAPADNDRDGKRW